MSNTKTTQARLFVFITKCSQHNSAQRRWTVRKWWSGGEGRDFQYFDSWRVAGEAFQHFQLYLQVEQFRWFCSFSLTKLPWRQWRPKAEKIYERWKRKVEWAQLSVIWNIALPGRYIKQASILTTLTSDAVDHRLKSLSWIHWVVRGKENIEFYLNDSKY